MESMCTRVKWRVTVTRRARHWAQKGALHKRIPHRGRGRRNRQCRQMGELWSSQEKRVNALQTDSTRFKTNQNESKRGKLVLVHCDGRGLERHFFILLVQRRIGRRLRWKSIEGFLGVRYAFSNGARYRFSNGMKATGALLLHCACE